MVHPVQFINTKPWIPLHILMSGNAALIFPAIKNWGENAFLTDELHSSWMGCPSSHGLWLAVIQMLSVLLRFTMTSVLLSFSSGKSSSSPNPSYGGTEFWALGEASLFLADALEDKWELRWSVQCGLGKKTFGYVTLLVETQNTAKSIPGFRMKFRLTF